MPEKITSPDVRSEPQAARKVFRFKTWRPKRDSAALRVDEALDLIGRRLFADDWGRQPGFDQLPLFEDGGGGLFTLARAGKRYNKVAIEQPSEELLHLEQQFRNARNMLQLALRSNFKAAAMHMADEHQVGLRIRHVLRRGKQASFAEQSRSQPPLERV